MRYLVTAHFKRSIKGETTWSSEGGKPDDRVYAETPLGAARKAWWRLTKDQMNVTVRIVVSAPQLPERPPYPIYVGPPISWRVIDGNRWEDEAPAAGA